jgi:hypothetical protein
MFMAGFHDEKQHDIYQHQNLKELIKKRTLRQAIIIVMASLMLKAAASCIAACFMGVGRIHSQLNLVRYF